MEINNSNFKNLYQFSAASKKVPPSFPQDSDFYDEQEPHQFEYQDLEDKQIELKSNQPIYSSELFNAFKQSSNGIQKSQMQFKSSNQAIQDQQISSNLGNASRLYQKQGMKTKNELNNSVNHYQQNMEFLHSQNAKNYQLQSVQHSASKKEDLVHFTHYQKAQFVAADNSDSSSTERHMDQEQLMTEQDFDGHEHEEENIYDDDDEQQYQSDEYEGNIPGSSKSVSHEKAERIQREEDIQDEDEEEEEECKNKEMLQSVESPVMTNKSSQKMKTNEKYGVVERSEKFIIYKMVPQINKKEDLGNGSSQPTPSLSQKANISSKTYRETVEDNEDQSESEEEEVVQKQELTNEQSCFCGEDQFVQQNEIKIVQNKLISSTLMTQQQLVQIKPPIIKKEESQQVVTNLSRVIQLNRASSLQQHQSKNASFEDNDLKDDGFLNRQSSDKFQKLQKLEKKSILDEGVEGGEMTLTINFMNQVNSFACDEKNTEVQIVGRRQSESAVQRKSTLTEVVEQKIIPKNEESKALLKAKAQNALKKELMMLEEELNNIKKKKEQQVKAQKQIEIVKPVVQQKKQVVEKKNFFIGEGQLHNDDGSFLSMDNESNDSLPHFKRKSITPSGANKQMLQSKGNIGQKETTKADDGKKKMFELNQKMENFPSKGQKSSKPSQRVSPHKNNNLNIKSNRNITSTRQPSKHNRSRSRKQNTSLSYSSEQQRSESEDRKHKRHRKHIKQNQSRQNNKRKASQHHRHHSSSEEDSEESSSQSYSDSESSYSEEEESYYSSDEQSNSEYDDESDSHNKHRHHNKHYRKIQKNTEGNTYHMHYKCNRHEGKQGKRFRIKIQAVGQVAVVSKHLELDFRVRDCGSHKKKCLCRGSKFLCIQVFYQVQEIMNILQYFAKSLTLFELVKMQSDKMKFALNCGKEMKSMYAIHNNQSQYVICLSQNLDCISTLAGYKMQTAASGFLMQQPFQQQQMTIPVNLMIQPQQQQMSQNLYIQPQQQQQNPVYIQQQMGKDHSVMFFGNNQQNTSQLNNKNNENYVTEVPQQQRQLQRNLSSHSLNQQAIQQQRSHHLGIQQYQKDDQSPYRDDQNSRKYLNQLKNRFLQATSNQQQDDDHSNSRNYIQNSYQSQHKEDKPLFSYDQNDKYYPQKNHLRAGSLMDYKIDSKQQRRVEQRQAFSIYDDESYNQRKDNRHSPDFNNERKQAYQSPEEKDSCDDESMDEGVQASAARESTLRSPKTGSQFQGILLKHNNNMGYRSPQNLSNKKILDKSVPLVALDVGGKKKEQAIIIGFSEGTGVNPFAKKPVLKGRTPINNNVNNNGNIAFPSQKQERDSVINRSKSVRNQAQQNKTTKKQDEVVNQLKSPTNTQAKQRSSFKPGESPLKKAVIDIKHKENIDRKTDEKPMALDPKLKVLEHDPSDPMHNKSLMIEIFDKKKHTNKGQQEVSLAEMFNAKKKDLGTKETKKIQDVALDQDSIAQEQEDKKPKTKQELAQLRKQMMKSKVKIKQNNFVNDGCQDVTELTDGQKSKKSNKDPPNSLMHRLALGQKPQIDQKEMKKLTTRNYSNLPEIKKKKEEEKKREEQQARKNAAQDFVKKQNEKRKAMLKKKKSIVDDE